MTTILDALMNAAAGIAAAGITGALWLNIRWIFQSKNSMEKILEELIRMRGNMTVLYRMQGPLLVSLKASLEAQRDGECNGNVDEALRLIADEKKKFDEHLLASIAGSEPKEKKE